MVDLASLDAIGSPEGDAGRAFRRLTRGEAALRPATPLLRRFEVPEAVELVFFFMGHS